MKVAFFSNYLSIHQIPFCEEMSRLSDFTFVATTPFNQERLGHGYTDLNLKYPFVLNAYLNQQNKIEAKKLAIDADIVILGHAPFCYAKNRLRQNRITFMYSERPCKENDAWIKEILRSVKYRIKYPKNKPLYMLCASSYTASDYEKYGVFIGKCYKWGYFPKRIQYENVEKILQNKEPNSIIWVARMLDWKHPEVCVALADRLQRDGYDFHVHMIGNGPMFKKVEQMIRDLKLEKYITLYGTLNPEEVRSHMEKAEVFLFTSDRNEGWGAVLNESMNSLCIPVSSIEAGATGFLIHHSVNGYAFEIYDQNTLISIIKSIFDNPLKGKLIANNAYKTISDAWNAKEAAERLLVLSNVLLCGKETPYSDGPCSKSI